jgi:hypothetical protein
MQQIGMLFDANVGFQPTRAAPSCSSQVEDLWLSFGEEQRNLYRWMVTFGLSANIAEPSAKSGSQAELQSTPLRASGCSCCSAWNPQAVKP